MSRRKLESTTDFQRALKNKYGLGSGANYKPWLRVQDVRSHGSSAKINGLKTQREHHMLSEHESCFFYTAEFCDSVIDIREQFPLLPLDLSVRISKTLCVKHPAVPSTKTPSVMTTDFLLTRYEGDRVWHEAVSVKPSAELSKVRNAEKLDIERIWWELLGVPFHIFTMSDQNRVTSRNIEWITSPLRRGEEVSPSIVAVALSILKPGIYILKSMCEELADEFNLSAENALTTLRYLLARKLIKANLTKPIVSVGLLEITYVSSPAELQLYAG